MSIGFVACFGRKAKRKRVNPPDGMYLAVRMLSRQA